MRTTFLTAALAATALSTSLAMAQTTPSSPPAGTPAAGSTQFMTQMSPNLMRGSKLIGVDVYGTDNQKIGDVDELLLDRDGKVQAIIVGVGGFLGIGEKNVAISLSEIQWMWEEPARTASTAANPAAGVTPPASPSATNQPSATGSTAPTAAPTAVTGDEGNAPARAMVKMTKADLQNAPEFRYRSADAGRMGNTNPPANPNRPATQQ